MPRPAVVICSWLALLGVGCASATVAYDAGQTAKVRPAPAAGDYLLFRAADEPGRSEKVVARQTLERREPVGFAREGNGPLVAVAGDSRTPLSEGRYRWQAAPTADRADARLESAGQRYMHALEPVGGAIAFVVIAPVVLVMGALGIPLPFSK